ncbi:unnamed protein product [Rhodiola kirilowii]
MDSGVNLLSSPVTDFNFDSGCSTPYISAPSSPARIPNFFRPKSQLVDQFYHQLPTFKDAELCLEPRVAQQGLERSRVSVEEVDFAFDFGQGTDSAFAEELFDDGKIRALKQEPVTSPAAAITLIGLNDSNNKIRISPDRRSPSSLSSRLFAHSRGRKSRSVSIWDLFPFSMQYRKWKLKDLLFRSKSAGQSAREKPIVDLTADLKNDAVMRSSSLPSSVERGQYNESNSSLSGSNRRTNVVDGQSDRVKSSNLNLNLNESCRSNESGGLNRTRRRARSISAHELHYTLNRAASERMRTRTFLPYKQGLLGCLGLGSVNDVVGRVGSMSRC